ALLLFVALAGRLPRPRWPGSRRTLVVGAVLLARAGLEELFWRSLVLGAGVRAVPGPGALALSSAGFAYVHRRKRHVLTGGAFGLLYLASGRLAAPIAAHGLYNVLVWMDGRRGIEPTPEQAAAADLRAVSTRFAAPLALDG